MKRKASLLILIALAFVWLFPIQTKANQTKDQITTMTSSEQFELLVDNIENTHEYYFNSNFLSAPESQLYRALVTHFSYSIDNYNQPVKWTNNTGTNLSKDDLEKAIQAFSDDYKIFYWLTGNVNYSFSQGGLPVNYEFNFEVLDIYENKSDFEKDLQEIIINRELIKEEVLKQKNTYQQIKIIHDWLVINNTYNKSGDESHTPVGALVAKYSPVCEAYSEAFQMIANYVGIPSIYGTGVATSGGTSENHAWNYVKILNTWYFLDVTWAKPLGASNHNYNYFLTTIPNSHVKTETEVLPTPFTKVKYDASNLAEFEVTTSFIYERDGSPITGYDTITLLNSDANIKIVYYNEFGNMIASAPTDLGKYYFVATADSISISGDIVIHFEIVPLIHRVNFYNHLDEIIETQQVVDGGNASPPNPNRDGFRFINWSEDYTNVKKPLEIKPTYEKIEVVFVGLDDLFIKTNIDIFTAENIINYPFDLESPSPNEIFVGWQSGGVLITPETVLTKDYILRPVFEEVEFNIKNAKREDDLYLISENRYNKEEITLVSDNQYIKSQEIDSDVDEDGNYVIKIVVATIGSTAEMEILINAKQTTFEIFGLNLKNIILYAGIALIVIIIAAAGVSVIKSRKE